MKFRTRPVGWRYEAARHSLAARGYRTKRDVALSGNRHIGVGDGYYSKSGFITMEQSRHGRVTGSQIGFSEERAKAEPTIDIADLKRLEYDMKLEELERRQKRGENIDVELEKLRAEMLRRGYLAKKRVVGWKGQAGETRGIQKTM
jgi:hypothetical protein